MLLENDKLQVWTPPRTWVLSGQSNAVGLKPYLEPYATIIGSAQGSTPISAWNEGQPLWYYLDEALRMPFNNAFIWWQGENNIYDIALYPTWLDDLIRRVQAVVGRHRVLRVVICGVTDIPSVSEYAQFRTMQAEYAAARGFSFVRSDDITPHPMHGDFDPPSGGTWQGADGMSPHLTIEGYRTMARRIATVLS